MPLSVEENFKLLAAYCLFNGDVDKVAKYMSITKNAVNKRYAKLIADEKINAVKLGLMDGGATPKKRAAPPTPMMAAKKAKMTEHASTNDGAGAGAEDDDEEEEEEEEVKIKEDEEKSDF